MSKTLKGTIQMPKSVTKQNIDLEVESLTANFILSESNIMTTVNVAETTVLNELVVDDQTNLLSTLIATEVVADSVNAVRGFTLPRLASHPVKPNTMSDAQFVTIYTGFMFYNTTLSEVVVCEKIDNTHVSWRQLSWN